MTKYPAHSTEPYKSPKEDELYLGPYKTCDKCGLDWYACKCSKKSPTVTVKKHHNMPPVWLRYLFVGCLAVLIGGMWIGTMYLDERAQKVSNAVPVLHTNTAEHSQTPKDTHTPFPTFTQPIPTLTAESGYVTATTAQNGAMVLNDNEIIYIENFVTVEVTKIIEIIITATPLPATATLAPTWTPTPTYDAAAFAAKIERSKMLRYEMLAWVGDIFLSILVMTLVFLISFSAIRSTIKYYIDKRREQLEAVQDEPSRQIQINDINRERRIIKLHQAGWTISKIQEKIFGYTGGADFYTVQNIIDEYERSRTTPPPHEDVPELGAT